MSRFPCKYSVIRSENARLTSITLKYKDKINWLKNSQLVWKCVIFSV